MNDFFFLFLRRTGIYCHSLNKLLSFLLIPFNQNVIMLGVWEICICRGAIINKNLMRTSRVVKKKKEIAVKRFAKFARIQVPGSNTN